MVKNKCMTDQDRHKWAKIPHEPDDGNNLKAKHRCIRGDCGCIRSTFVYFHFKKPYTSYVYERGAQVYSDRPLCYGDILINDQGID